MCVPGFAAEKNLPKNVLYLTTSEGFEHSVIAKKGDESSHSGKILKSMFEKMGAAFTETKDASVINAESLKKYDLVIFYTQGDLTKPNKSGSPVMGENGVAELLAWIEAGGRFMGFHAATDTLRAGEERITPYVDMIGAEFKTHGKQFKGAVKVVVPGHPVVAAIPDGWELNDEWYIFRNWNEEDLCVLALLDPGAEREKQESYNIPSYPVIWVRTLGAGRVYFSALGHREDVWTNATFQQTVVDAVEWAMAGGDAQATPNFKAVVPSE